ncbi:hypothetical protein GU926_09490 [Nibribacter ruber]|uniref:Uncharacterized protein n=1 Tax=Nibribacter ruber TaxID=2698458 RepID=A0A6P1NVA5_9BACT|nr:hypothetical protein [Nibribacter ruber]QHL87657.1 hypothetical protein GU926_09490 [Nibribacter ruber]
MITDSKEVVENTDLRINFRGVEFGTSLKDAKQALGKPDLHANRDMEVEGHEILFYTSSIGSVRVTQCLHFKDNGFFLGQTIVRRPTQEQYKAFLEKVLDKYDLFPAKGLAVSELEEQLPVIDMERNRIEFTHAFHLTINYISGNPKVAEAFEDVRNQKQRKRSSARASFKEQVENFI